MSEQLRSAEVAGDPWASMLATSIDAWYAGDLARGRAACEALLSRRDLPDHIRTQTERNLMHYSRSLPDLAPGVTFFHLPRFAERGWSWFNPTLAVDDDGVHVLVRSSNYTIQSGRRYAAFDREGLIRTRYTRLRLDDGFGLRELAPVHDETGEDGRSDFPVRGYEDCRVVVKDDAWHVIGTARDRNPDGVCQQVHMRLESDAWVDARKISAPDDGYQKNWMPFVADGELVAIQYCHPLTVVRIGPETNGAETIARHETTPLARSFRGGSQGVAIEHGTLFVIHEAVDRSAEERVYLHRFIVVDAEFHLTHISPQFFFTGPGIEFCAGLARHGNDLLLGFGVDDAEAYLARVPLDEVTALLRAVDDDETRPEIAPVSGVSQTREPDLSRIVSVTLAGPGTAGMIGDALRSVAEHVDACLVVDTGIGAAGLAVAREVAGDRLVVRTLEWPNDFAAARNAAFDLAAETGAGWAVIVDTDERLRLDHADVRGYLRDTTDEVLTVPHAGGTYAKPRMFRLPAPGRWIGATHEYFDRRRGTQGALPRASFDEIAKSPERLQAKLTRDVGILRRMTEQHPRNARWWYYLGDTLGNLGDTPGAIAAFDRCATLDGWAEEGAWARYREAECWIALENMDEAVRSCAAGLERHPGVAELAWLAGFASWKAKRYRDAVHWSRLALVHGEFGDGVPVDRVGFRNPMALREGPYDVLRFALRALGDDAGADAAEREFARARRAGES